MQYNLSNLMSLFFISLTGCYIFKNVLVDDQVCPVLQRDPLVLFAGADEEDDVLLAD